MGTNLMKPGFTAQIAPQMKRATATLTDGSAVAIVPDPAITTQVGADDVSGTPMLRIFKSDIARTTWALNFGWNPVTPAPQICSSTKGAVCSMVLDGANNLHLVYQGMDNSLQYAYFPYTAGNWAAPTVQVVAAANAVTNRYRAVDIDVPNNGTTANVAIIAYESKASNGPGAWIRVHIRNSDGITWRTAYTQDMASFTGGLNNIYPQSEDASISWGTTGITANVGQLLIYYNSTVTFYDNGERISEIQYNVSTGTDGSATTLGNWPMLNQDIGTPFRRGWIFKTANNIWQVATVAGLTLPKFSVMRLTHGQFSQPIINTYGSGLNVHRSSPLAPTVSAAANSYNFIACSYSDNRVFFGFITPSTPVHMSQTYSLVGLVFRYDDISTYTTSYNDITMRPLDNYFKYGQQPIGVYGSGNNRNQSGDFKFNFLGLYGYQGNVKDGSQLTQARYILDTFYDAPSIVGPVSTVANNTPTLLARVQNSALFPNIKGKIEFQLARDGNFTSDLRTIGEPDANYRYFGSNNASNPPAIPVSLALSGVGAQKLYSGQWNLRARVVSDLGQYSAWSANTTSFYVSHQPTALPSYPTPGSTAEYGTGNITFSWTFSDTEPTDTQTAYQLLIQRIDTGATVYDSAKVLSSVKSATVAIAAANKDVSLQWSVSLWDTDNVQGPFSNPSLFVVSDSPSVALTGPTNGATVTAAAPTVTWTFTGSGTRTQNAYRVYISKPDILDTFVRTAVVNSWGTSDNGVPWTNDGNASVDYSTDGTFGKHNYAAVNTRKRSVGGQMVTDSIQRITVQVPVVATGAAIEAGLIARRRDSLNYYYGGALFNTDGTISAFFGKRVGSTTDTLITSAVLPGLTYTAGSKWDIRFSCIGNQLRVKVWSTSGQEKSYAYGLTITDTTHSTAGLCGVTSNVPTGNTNTLPVAILFDNYAKDDPNAAYVADSGWLQGNIGSYAFAANVMANNSYYVVWLIVQDNSGMQVNTSSAVISQWTHPALGTPTVTLDDFGATIAWTNAPIDISFISWRVYRRYQVPALVDLDDSNTATTWTLVYETIDGTGPYSFKDYLIPLNKSVDYVVVQVADRFGSVIESNITSFTTVKMTANRYYFIPSVPIGSIASYEASYVTDDTFTDEVEQQTLHIIGRGRQVQVGDDLGVTGTLTVQLRNPTGARADREFIQRLASNKTINVWIKNPFGDVKYVRFGNVGIKLLSGVGQDEKSDLTVPYTEVFAPAAVTRAS